eukprot:SAG31_NODE_34616_length_331_cov_0.862069_2_plen_30_part_01
MLQWEGEKLSGDVGHEDDSTQQQHIETMLT